MKPFPTCQTDVLARWETAVDWSMPALALGSIPLLVFERSVSWVESVAVPLNWAITGAFAIAVNAAVVGCGT